MVGSSVSAHRARGDSSRRRGVANRESRAGLQERIAFLPVRDLHLPHNLREVWLSRELVRRGWQVSWLRPRSGTNRGVQLDWPVLEYPDLDVRGRKYALPAYLAGRLRAERIRILWLSGWTMRDPRELAWLVRILAAAGTQVVYDPIDPVCEFLEAQGAGADEVVRCRRAARAIYHACSLTMCVTPEIREMLASAGAPRDRLHVARWGTDGTLFDPANVKCDLKQRLGLSEQTRLVGWLGTMEPFKGLHEVILPIVEMIGSTGNGIHFVIAGRGPLEASVREWANARTNLPVTILPSIEYHDAPAFTGSLDAYLVPTNPMTRFAQSICPVKCFDALAMGTPLIVSRTPATEFLGPHTNLVRFADFNAASFANALLGLLASVDRQQPRTAVREYTHQTVSTAIADAIIQMRQSGKEQSTITR